MKNLKNITTHCCCFSNHGGIVKRSWVVMKHASAFLAFSGESVDAVNYHNRLLQRQDKDKTVRMLIDERRTELEAKEQNHCKLTPENDPLLHVNSEAQEAMADFEAALNDNNDVDLDAMIQNLNEDQLRIFGIVSNHVHRQCTPTQTEIAQPLHMFISGCGGIGKSYLIKTIKA